MKDRQASSCVGDPEPKVTSNFNENSKFLTTPTPTPPAANVAALRKRTTTLNSWHSACDHNPDAVIPSDGDDDDDDNGDVSRNGLSGEKSTDRPSSSSCAKTSAAPDGGWGWMCVLGCSIIHAILGGIGKSFGLIHVALTESLNESDFAVSWIHASCVCCRMCIGPLASMLFAKGFSCRQIVMVGGSISMSMYFVSSFVAFSLWTLFVTMGLLVGFGGALVYTPSILIVGQYFDRHKSMANGFAVMGTGLGALLMPVIIQTSLTNYGLSGALLILGGVSFHSCVCGALYFPLRQKSPGGRSDGEKLILAVQPADVTKDDKLDRDEGDLTRQSAVDRKESDKMNEKQTCVSFIRRFLHSLKTFFKEGIDVSLFRDWTFWVLTASQFLSPFGFMPNLYYMPKLALALWADDGGLSTEERRFNAALLISVNGIADIVGRAMFGVVTNYGTLKRHRALVYAICPFACATGAFMAPFIGGRGFPYLAVCAAITGFFSGGYISLTPSILSDALGR